MKLMKNTLTVSKMIAIGDRKATIAIAIVDLFSYGDRDRNLKFHEDRDRDRDRNFRDRANTLRTGTLIRDTRVWSTVILI